jgi:hypothetical protein
MAQNREGEPSFSETEGVHGFSETHRLFQLSGNARGILAEVGSVLLFRAPYTLRQSGGMEEGPLSWLISAILFACTRVDTCHPWNCMRSISMHPLCTFSPCQELRIKIKHKMHMFFGIIIKYYSQGLSP